PATAWHRWRNSVRAATRLLRELSFRKDLMLPLSKGAGSLGLPRFERFYFQFGAPISTTEWAGEHDKHQACWTLREKVKASIERSLQELREEQRNDPKRWLERPFSAWRKRLRGLRRTWNGDSPQGK
ncbi:MAG: hypothetical protein P1V97_15835, partial [Planctomycetota bacterium]|nr:hypothetical protein [Planctomycetota bacterium]